MYSLRIRKLFLACIAGLLAFTPGLNGRSYTPVHAQEAKTQILESGDCQAGTGWIWTSGPDQPDTARQVEIALSEEGIVGTVMATGFGEKDSCGNFALHATDFVLSIQGDTFRSPAEQQALADKLMPILIRFANPKLGNVRIDYASGGSQFFPGSASSFHGSPASAASLSAASALNRKVYLLVYDPLLSNGQHLSEYTGWNSYESLVQGIIDFYQSTSQGQIQYSIAYKALVTDEWPVKIDGFRYTEETYLAVLQNQAPAHDPDTVDYDAILDNPALDLCGKLNRGEIDELWMYGAPWFGFYESRLVGPDAYMFNSPPVSGTHGCDHLLPIMGLSYERGLSEAIESFGHRTEATMAQAYGGWQENRTAHNWDRFGLVKAQSPDYSYSGCGSVHYPPNATQEYEYDHVAPILSNCEDFRNYPALSDPLVVAQPVSCTAWNCNSLDYFRYWYGHLPSVSGCTAAVNNNWWHYFASPGLALNSLLSCPLSTKSLTINKSGIGSGVVTSNPAGIQCGQDCSQDYFDDTVVTLYATPASNSWFSGWSGGGCTGSLVCTLTMTEARNVTANFDKEPTFADVPTSHPYLKDIEILYANGYTSGCSANPLRFCPDQTLNRGESAVFILRGTYGASFVPGPATHIFRDDWRKNPWAEPWSEAMFKFGISGGCQSTPVPKYCPWNQIPREQAAVFAVRLKYGAAYRPPAATGTLFADMTNTTNIYTAWAEQAYRDGLIPACGTSSNKPKICPKALVSRGLAAFMIVRARDLHLP
jgi:hypothetical protein